MKKLSWYQYVWLSLSFMALTWAANYFSSQSNTQALNHFEKRFKQYEQTIQSDLKQFAREVEKGLAHVWLENTLPKQYRNNAEQGFFVYGKDSLQFWSTNEIPVPATRQGIAKEEVLVKLKNGWFLVEQGPPLPGNLTLYAYTLLKHDFAYQNQYLHNRYANQWKLPEETTFHFQRQGKPIFNQDGKYLFSLEWAGLNPLGSFWGVARALCFWVAVLFLVFAAIQYIQQEDNAKQKAIKIIGVIGLLWLLRLTLLLGRWESQLDPLTFFGPQNYADASSILWTSLGDFILNGLLVWLCIYLLNQLPEYTIKHYNQKKASIASVFQFSLAVGGTWFVHQRLLSLLKNSNISFEVNKLFELDGWSMVGLAAMAIWLMALYRFIYFVYTKIKTRYVRNIRLGVFSIVAFLSLAALTQWNWPTLLIPVGGAALIIVLQTIPFNHPWWRWGVLLLLYSIYASWLVNNVNTQKELTLRRFALERLAETQDPVAEHLFEELIPAMLNDSALVNAVNRKGENFSFLDPHVRQNYFGGYWEKYNVYVSLFDSACAPLIRSNLNHHENTFFLDEKIKQNGKAISESSNVFVLKNTGGKIQYLAKLGLPYQGKPYHKALLYLELESAPITQEIGFPELLLDNSLTDKQPFSEYAFAKYQQNQLISQKGKYPFPNSPEQFTRLPHWPQTIDLNGFNHAIFPVEPGSWLILSKPASGLFERMTVFSAFFTVFSLFWGLWLLITQPRKLFFWRDASFSFRVQFMQVLIVAASLGLLGAATLFFIKRLNGINNRKLMIEKGQSVLLSLQESLNSTEALNQASKSYTTYTLKKLSNVFSSDLTLYDPAGNVFSSSRPELFEQGLLAFKLDPEAYRQMILLQNARWVQDEEVGNLDYLSGYLPFRNRNGKLMGILNLPYFARQSEMQNDLSSVMATLVNLYVLIFALAALVAILIGKWFTRPLQLLRDKLASVKLGERNQAISWNNNDEIGNLIQTYNQMVEQLSESAHKLAQSEREGAWREMARQVAHEIKNPLTPMKLGVQHLQKVMNDKAPDMEQRIAKLSHSLIEQIDTLSNIATAFSSFAQMPTSRQQPLDMKSVAQTAVHVFENATKIPIQLHVLTQDPIQIMGDKEQWLRVFNNLIKNALQALENTENPHIRINLDSFETHCLIEIRDNGTGISDEALAKIFQPSFTTKTGGMGLGLAMVKSIVEQHGGTIQVSSIKNMGTNFTIRLPLLQNS